jgi:hypothetical protein
MQPHPGERRREEVAGSKAPQHWPFEAGENAAHEQDAGSPMLGGAAARHDFVKGAQRKPAFRQAPVEIGHVEG